MRWKLRPYSESDFALVIDSWLKSSREHGLSGFKRSDIVKLIETKTIRICCDEEKPEVIHGWICHGVHPYGGPQLWYVYVKEMFRRQGLASWLIRSTMPEQWAPVITTPEFEKLRAKLKASEGDGNNGVRNEPGKESARGL